MTSRLVQSRGNVYWEGVRAQRKRSTYRWFPIGETGYVLVTVNPQDLQRYRSMWSGSLPSTCPYHADDNGQIVCNLYNRTVSYESRIFFSSEAFKADQFYRTIADNIGAYCEYLRGGNIRRNNWFKPAIRDTLAATEAMFELISEDTFETGILYYQLATVSGVHRMIPGMRVPEDYNPLSEPWFARCRTSNGPVTLSLPQERPQGLALSGISFCKPLYYHSAKQDTDKHLYGLLNVMVRLDKAWKLLAQGTSQCLTNVCFVMNEAGMILLHSEWFRVSPSHPSNGYTRTHIMEKEPHIAMDLVAHGYATEKDCAEADFDQGRIDGPRVHKAWQIGIGANRDRIDRKFYRVTKIRHTNVFLVAVLRNPEGEICTCFPNHGKNEQTEECRGTNQCFCPCYKSNLDQYDFCSGILSLTTDSSVPCTPEAIQYTFYDLEMAENRALSSCQPTPTAVTTTGDKQKNGSSRDYRIWIAVGAAVLLCLVVVTIVVLSIYRRRQQKDKTYAGIMLRPAETPGYSTPELPTSDTPTHSHAIRIPAIADPAHSHRAASYPVIDPVHSHTDGTPVADPAHIQRQASYPVIDPLHSHAVVNPSVADPAHSPTVVNHALTDPSADSHTTVNPPCGHHSHNLGYRPSMSSSSGFSQATVPEAERYSRDEKEETIRPVHSCQQHLTVGGMSAQNPAQPPAPHPIRCQGVTDPAVQNNTKSKSDDYLTCVNKEVVNDRPAADSLKIV